MGIHVKNRDFDQREKLPQLGQRVIKEDVIQKAKGAEGETASLSGTNLVRMSDGLLRTD
jgi:hypothetical protein